MKVLWIVNTMFPDLCIAKGLEPTVIGGWMYETARSLNLNENIVLTVVTTGAISTLEYYKINDINYYIIPSDYSTKYNDQLRFDFGQILDNSSPDVIHIHGSEFPHGLVALKNFPQYNYILSMQGLVSIYARYYLSGLSFKDIFFNLSLRDILKGSLFKEQKMFYARGFYEREYYLRLHHVIGRTNWDYVHSKTINPNISYHFCNESLRKGFYQAESWDITRKVNFQIFLSQAGYPIKGLHQLLKAVRLLKEDFPTLKVRVGGADIMRSGNSFKEKLKISGYGIFIRKLIKKYELQQNVEFLGFLNEEQMISEYQMAHVFVCPSSIENSPNSVGEAQIIGTPVIASYVGGVSEMISHGEDGFIYRFEEFEMLAYYIRQVFTDSELCESLSEKSKIVASKRHNLDSNNTRLINIYKTICK